MSTSAPAWAGRRIALRTLLPRREDALAAAGLLALALFLFRDAVFGGQVLFVRDINMVWLPLAESFVRTVASGAWPLWDPYSAFGRPMLADPRAQVLYPPTWLNLVMLPWTYYTLFVTGHLVLSGFGLYAACRRLGRTPLASFVGAAVWMASGPLLSLASVWHHMAAAAWMPWILLAGEVALSSGRVRHALWWAAAIAAQVLAGSPEISLLSATVIALWIAARHFDWRAPLAQPNRRRLLVCVIAVVGALMLSAGQWLPSLEIGARSGRWSLPYSERTSWSLHPANLVQLAFPVFYGELPPLRVDEETIRELQLPWLYSSYLGIPALALAFATLGVRPVRGVLWWCLGGAALWFAIGRHSYFYALAAALLPPLQALRFPTKAMLVTSLCWSMLAALGLDAWREANEPLRRSRLVIAALSLLTAGAWVGWILASFAAARIGPSLPLGQSDPAAYASALAPIGGRLLVAACLSTVCLALVVGRSAAARRGLPVAVLLGALAASDLAQVHRNLHVVAPKQIFTRRPEVLQWIEQKDHSRLYVYDYSMDSPSQRRKGEGWKGYPVSKGLPGFTPLQALVLAVHMYVNPNTGSRWGLQGSFDLDIPGLDPAPLAQLADFLRAVEETPLHLRLLRLGAVARVLALHPAKWWNDLEPLASVEDPFAKPIRVFRVPRPLPRTYVVDGVRAADGPRAFQELATPDFDPEREVVLAAGAGTSKPAGSSPAGTSRIVETRADRVRLLAELDRPGYVVLVDAYDPGWKAFVDGIPAPLLRANVAFRAAAVAAGRHSVEFVYRPRVLLWGLGISLVSWSGLVMTLAMGAFRRERPTG